MVSLDVTLYVTLAVITFIVILSKALPYFCANEKEEATATPPGFRRFQFHSIFVFLLAMAANWFYGPHLMELYAKNGYDAWWQSIFLATGFATAALSGLVIGQLADSFGRKKSCILYAICYGINIACHHFINYPSIIFVGRAFAGIATALLYCCFESWMICAHFDRKYPGELLGSTFSIAWGLNYPVAVGVGLLCDATSLVPWGLVGDFDASGFFLLVMVVWILVFWEENHGNQSLSFSSLMESYLDGFRYFSTSWNVWMLTIIQTCFEAPMFVFVRWWFNVLQEDRDSFKCGSIFALFMISCMLGTEILRVLKLYISKRWISVLYCAISAIVFALLATGAPIFGRGSENQFYAKIFLFCLFEVCVGIYFNVMTDLRGEHIDDSVRASIAALCRVPMNFIVIGLLLFTKAETPIIAGAELNWNSQFYILVGLCSVGSIAAGLIKEKVEVREDSKLTSVVNMSV